jgi:hypothetical protein
MSTLVTPTPLHHMKKTKCIQLVLITAALAGCDRPLYQQGPAPTAPGPVASDSYDPYSPRPYYPPAGAYGSSAPAPDSNNSCPLAATQLPPDYYLWYSGLRPWDYFYWDWFNLDGYYAYRYPATIVRAGFGKIGYFRVGGTGHS